jgi:putative hydrolase of the HAD superfamily
MQGDSIELVLFDLGGVLVHWDGNRGLMKLTGGSLTEEDARRFWLHSPAVRMFESGLCSSEEFGSMAVSELGLKIRHEEWLQEFISWDRGPFPGAVELLESLRTEYELGCISNNNELHWSKVRDDHGFGELLPHQYLSHEIGLAKPDPKVFEHVIGDLEYSPVEILYIDDNPECVEAAERFGIRARRALGLDEVREVLAQELGAVES